MADLQAPETDAVRPPDALGPVPDLPPSHPPSPPPIPHDLREPWPAPPRSDAEPEPDPPVRPDRHR